MFFKERTKNMGFFDSVKKKSSENDKKSQTNNAFHEAKSTSFSSLVNMLRSGLKPNPEADVMIEHIKEEKKVKDQVKGDISVHTNTVKNHDELVDKIGHKQQVTDSPELSNVKSLQKQIGESQELIDEFNVNGDFSAAHKEETRLQGLQNELQKAINKYSQTSVPETVDISRGNVVSVPTSTQEPLRPVDEDNNDDKSSSEEMNIGYSNSNPDETNEENPDIQDNNSNGSEKTENVDMNANPNKENNNSNSADTEMPATDNQGQEPAPEMSNSEESEDSVSASSQDEAELSDEDKTKLMQQAIDESEKYIATLPSDLSEEDKWKLQDSFIESQLPQPLAEEYRKQIQAVMSLPKDKVTSLINKENQQSQEDSNISEDDELPVGYTEENNPNESQFNNESFGIMTLAVDPTFNTEVEIKFDNQLLNTLNAIMLNGSQILMMDTSGNITCLVDSETDVKMLRDSNPNNNYYKVSSDFNDLKSNLIVWLDSLENVTKNSLLNVNKYIINH